MSKKYDVVVIGAGPGGYVAAIRCAQLGLDTACVDEWTGHDGNFSLGGTCLNVGCIPSKALLESSQLFATAKNDFDTHGIKISKASLDLDTMMARKTKVVDELTQGIQGLFKTNRITLVHGHGYLLPDNKVQVKERDSETAIDTIEAGHIIVATGSSPVRLERAQLTDDYIFDSAGALEFNSVPERLGIIGAGAIGLELGSVWSRLGSEVVLMEAMDTFLPAADKQIAKAALRSYKKQGLDIHMSARLLSADVKNKKVDVVYEDENGQHKQTFDKLVVAVGRKPNSDFLFGDDMEIELDERRFILVNKYCETSVPCVYAIGDVVRGPMLAHKAMEEGVMVAERIAGQKTRMDYDLIPSVIYTHPEIAWVGKTEQDCKATDVPYKTGVFPLAASGRARAMGETEGMVKFVAHAETDRLLGVHIFSAQASELVAQAVTAMAMQASAEDVALTICAHPTLAESMHEAALAVDRRAIHIKN